MTHGRFVAYLVTVWAIVLASLDVRPNPTFRGGGTLGRVVMYQKPTEIAETTFWKANRLGKEQAI